MATILITGASGLLGSSLLPLLKENGHRVKTLSTKKTKNPDSFFWSVENKFIEDGALDGVDVIIHLAGANIGTKRWSHRHKKKIIDSRVASAELLLNHLKLRKQPLHQFISVSGIGYYPDPCNDIINENHKSGKGFLSEICIKWEDAAHRFREIHSHVCVIRTGPVLSKDGGYLSVIKKPLPIRILPVFGNHKNMLSWIHIEDVCGILNFAVENHSDATFNAVAPNPCSQIDFLRALASGKFCLHPVIPAILLKILLGERSVLPLSNQRVSSKKIQDGGYIFNYLDIKTAIHNLMIGQ